MRFGVSRGADCPLSIIRSVGTRLYPGEWMRVPTMRNARFVEEGPPLPLICLACGTRIRIGWKSIVGQAKCSRCGAPVPRLPARWIPWWIVLHLNGPRGSWPRAAPRISCSKQLTVPWSSLGQWWVGESFRNFWVRGCRKPSNGRRLPTCGSTTGCTCASSQSCILSRVNLRFALFEDSSRATLTLSMTKAAGPSSARRSRLRDQDGRSHPLRQEEQGRHSRRRRRSRRPQDWAGGELRTSPCLGAAQSGGGRHSVLEGANRLHRGRGLPRPDAPTGLFRRGPEDRRDDYRSQGIPGKGHYAVSFSVDGVLVTRTRMPKGPRPSQAWTTRRILRKGGCGYHPTIQWAVDPARPSCSLRPWNRPALSDGKRTWPGASGVEPRARRRSAACGDTEPGMQRSRRVPVGRVEGFGGSSKDRGYLPTARPRTQASWPECGSKPPRGVSLRGDRVQRISRSPFRAHCSKDRSYPIGIRRDRDRCRNGRYGLLRDSLRRPRPNESEGVVGDSQRSPQTP